MIGISPSAVNAAGLSQNLEAQAKGVSAHANARVHTHTHTHTQREGGREGGEERERAREGLRAPGLLCQALSERLAACSSESLHALGLPSVLLLLPPPLCRIRSPLRLQIEPVTTNASWHADDHWKLAADFLR